jgi:hypothetical protein
MEGMDGWVGGCTDLWWMDGWMDRFMVRWERIWISWLIIMLTD